MAGIAIPDVIYDPTIGRFISPDTVIQSMANPQCFNRYSYCLNNPLKYTDPSGQTAEEDYWKLYDLSQKKTLTKEDTKQVETISDRNQSEGKDVDIIKCDNGQKLVIINHVEKSDSILYQFTSTKNPDGKTDIDWGNYQYKEDSLFYDCEIWQLTDSRSGPETGDWVWKIDIFIYSTAGFFGSLPAFIAIDFGYIAYDTAILGSVFSRGTATAALAVASTTIAPSITQDPSFTIDFDHNNPTQLMVHRN
jgi:hypothetical protein